MSILLDHFKANVAPKYLTHFGDTLVMSTGAETQTITGVFLGSQAQQVDEDGFIVESEDDVIQVRTSDVRILIEKGTTFCHTVQGDRVEWSAYSEDSQPPWRYDEQQGRVFTNIRVKRVREESVAS